MNMTATGHICTWMQPLMDATAHGRNRSWMVQKIMLQHLYITANGCDRYRTLQHMDFTADGRNCYGSSQLMDVTADGCDCYRTLQLMDFNRTYS